MAFRRGSIILAVHVLASAPALAKPWPHVHTFDRCHIRLDPAPQDEHDQRVASVKARLGSGTRVQLDRLGSAVARIDFDPPFALTAKFAADADGAGKRALVFL